MALAYLKHKFKGLHYLTAQSRFYKSDPQILANLEAGGDGGVLIVGSFRVSYQVVPAGEHFPAEGEVPLLSSVPSLICVTSHPERKENPDASSLLM